MKSWEQIDEYNRWHHHCEMMTTMYLLVIQPQPPKEASPNVQMTYSVKRQWRQPLNIHMISYKVHRNVWLYSPILFFFPHQKPAAALINETFFQFSVTVAGLAGLLLREIDLFLHLSGPWLERENVKAPHGAESPSVFNPLSRTLSLCAHSRLTSAGSEPRQQFHQADYRHSCTAAWPQTHKLHENVRLSLSPRWQQFYLLIQMITFQNEHLPSNTNARNVKRSKTWRVWAFVNHRKLNLFRLKTSKN